MPALDIYDIMWPGLVSLLSAYQMATFAMKVGQSRRKFKIEPPTVTGDPEFIRTFRAQQNALEFYPMFLVAMWSTALFLHQVPAAILGIVYMIGRHKYFEGYIQDAKARLPGFYMATTSLRVMFALSLVGLVNTIVSKYAEINVVNLAVNKVWHTEL